MESQKPTFYFFLQILHQVAHGRNPLFLAALPTMGASRMEYRVMVLRRSLSGIDSGFLQLGYPAEVFFLPGKRRVQKGIHNFQRQPGPDDQRSQRQHVGVVVQPGGFGGKAIPAQGAADARHLVGRNGNADAGAANDYALNSFTFTRLVEVALVYSCFCTPVSR